MHQRKIEMIEFMKQFEDTPDRLLKYVEILLEGKDASPYCYQDTMSYRHLAISVNTYCNMNCTWCYRRNPEFKKILNKQMPINKLKKIIKNTEGRFKKIYIGGIGEPLLYKKYDEAIKIVRDITDNVVLTTNGSLLTEKRIDELTEVGLTHIEVSIDCYDKKMQKRHRGTDLDHLHHMVKYISDENRLNLRINSVVNNISYEYLINAVPFLQDCKNIDIYHIIPMYDVSLMRESGVHAVSTDDMKMLLELYREDLKRFGLKWELYPSPEGIGLYPSIEMKKKRNICFTCFESPCINIDGELVPCARQMTWKGVDATVGFEKAWNHPDLLKFRENMLKGDYPEYCGKLCYLKEKGE